jgi:hypothetical protein
MMTSFKAITGVVVAGSMFVSSTAVSAATTAAPAAQVNPWAALTVMSGGAPAVSMCGAATAAAQGAAGCVLPATDVPPPVAQPEGAVVPMAAAPVAGVGFSPLLIALAVLAAGLGVYLATKGGNNNGHFFGFPNSPA